MKMLKLLAFLIVTFGLCAQEFQGRTVRNMDELRALRPVQSRPMVQVLGYYSPGDGGGGMYVLTNTVSGVNAYGGRILAAGGGRSWQISNDSPIGPAQFGAIGDGTTDDTERVRLAVQWGSTRITQPQGKVYAVHQLVVTNVANQTWDGLHLKRLGGTTGSMMAFTNLYNATFSNCRFDASETSTGSTVDAVTLWSSTNVVFSANHFSGSTNQINSDLLTINGTYTTVTADAITDGGTYLIPTLVAPSENIVITGNTFEDAGQEGVMVRYGARNVDIVGNVFFHIPTGTGVTYKGNYGQVVGNVFWNTFFGMEVNSEDNIFGQGQDISYVDNKVFGSRFGFNASIGGTLFTSAINPTRSNGYVFQDYTPRRIYVANNTFKNLTHVGMHVRYVSDITIDSCHVYGVNTNLIWTSVSTGRGIGILLEGVNEGVVKNSTFVGATNENVYAINSTNLTLTKNTIHGQVIYDGTKQYTGWVRWHGIQNGGFIDNDVIGSYLLLYRGYNTAADGNKFSTYNDVTVAANTNYIVNNAILVDRNFRNGSISGNIIEGAAETAIKVTSTDANDGPYNSTLKNNIIQNGGLKVNSGYQGIEFQYATNWYVMDNFVSSSGPANRMSHAVKIYPTSTNIYSIRNQTYNLTRADVWDQTEYSSLTEYPHYSKHIRSRNNPSGIVTVTSGSTSVSVSFPRSEGASEAFTEIYKPFATPRWSTTCWVSNVSASGFTINFGTAPGADSFVYWRIE